MKRIYLVICMYIYLARLKNNAGQRGLSGTENLINSACHTRGVRHSQILNSSERITLQFGGDFRECTPNHVIFRSHYPTITMGPEASRNDEIRDGC